MNFRKFSCVCGKLEVQRSGNNVSFYLNSICLIRFVKAYGPVNIITSTYICAKFQIFLFLPVAEFPLRVGERANTNDCRRTCACIVPVSCSPLVHSSTRKKNISRMILRGHQRVAYSSDATRKQRPFFFCFV